MKIIYYVHVVSVILFMLHYLIKTGMLLGDSKGLAGYTKATRIIEMLISLTFLGTGGYMLMEMPEINNLMIIKLCMVFASIPIAIIGFKKGKKLLAVLAVLLIIGAYGMAEMSKKRGGKETSSLNGKEIFSANCARCHGDDGKAMLAGASDLSLSIMDEKQAAVIIEEGKGMMTPFKGTLTPEQIAEVAKYTGKLKQK